MFHVSRLNQSHMQRKTFPDAFSTINLRTACEFILYDARIIFIHCQGIHFLSKVRGMTISSNLLLDNEDYEYSPGTPPHAGSKQQHSVANSYP